jgi:uncharacterized membrane protein
MYTKPHIIGTVSGGMNEQPLLVEDTIINTCKTLDGQAMLIMLLLCMTWGLQQVVLKAAAPDIAPLLQLALRSGIAALLVGLLMLVRGERLSLHEGTWRPGLLVGLLFALEYLFVGEGLRHTSASHMVVFLYTAPIFAALGLHWKLPVERLQLFQWVGILLAFSGIVIAFYLRSQPTQVCHHQTCSGGIPSRFWQESHGVQRRL